MGVVMKGSGVSGCRENYAAPVPNSGESQPDVDTSGNQITSDVQFSQNSGNRETLTPPVPTFATNPVGQDDLDRLNAFAPPDIFKGAPNTGTRGGPA